MCSPFVFLLLFSVVYSETVTRFTNIKCEVLDPSYCAYKECRLKVLGRGIIGFNVHAILLKGPFNNAKVNLSLFRKYNGFRPFMFNATYDFCKLMDKPSKGLTFDKVISSWFFPNSNVNHSCPYEKEIIIKNFVLKEENFRYLPLPTGEYQLQVMAATDGQWKTRVYSNFVRKEDTLKN